MRRAMTPTIRPVTPTASAVPAESLADFALAAAPLTAEVALSTRGVSWLMLAASALRVGFLTGNSTPLGSTTVLKVLSLEVNFSSIF